MINCRVPTVFTAKEKKEKERMGVKKKEYRTRNLILDTLVVPGSFRC